MGSIYGPINSVGSCGAGEDLLVLAWHEAEEGELLDEGSDSQIFRVCGDGGG